MDATMIAMNYGRCKVAVTEIDEAMSLMAKAKEHLNKAGLPNASAGVEALVTAMRNAERYKFYLDERADQYWKELNDAQVEMP